MTLIHVSYPHLTIAFGNMAGLLVASFLCYFTGFIGPFAFVGKNKLLLNELLGGICLVYTVFLN